MGQRFWNIFVMWGSFGYHRMLLLRSRRWWPTMEMISLPDTIQVLLTGFASMALSTASESTLSDLPYLDRVSSCNPSEISSTDCTFTFRPTNVFGCFPNCTTRYVRLCGFQITHRMKQCTTWQLTNYHDTTNHSGYLTQLYLLWYSDICATNYHVLKYCKTFDSPKYFCVVWTYLYFVPLTEEQVVDSIYFWLY